MNDYKDKITNNERRYIFLVPLLFLLGFGLFIFRFVIGMDVEFDIKGKSGTFINVLGAIITGYGLSAECTIIHYMLNQIRKSKGFVKALLIVLFVPSLSAGALISSIMTIPYCYMCSQKIIHIKSDNYSVLLKWQKIVLIILGLIDFILLVTYFIVM